MTLYAYGCDDGLHTIKFQKYRLEHFCKVNDIGTIDKWFSDTWRSLYDPFLERPEAKLLMLNLKEGDTVVAYSPERIFSVPTETAKICRLFSNLGIKVAFLMFNEYDPSTHTGAKGIQVLWERMLLQTKWHPKAKRRTRLSGARFLGYQNAEFLADISERMTATAFLMLSTHYGVTPNRIKNYLLRTSRNFKELAQAAWLNFPRIRLNEDVRLLIPPKDSDRDERREFYAVICDTIKESEMWLTAQEIADIAGVPMNVLLIRLAELVRFRALEKVRQDGLVTYRVREDFKIHEVPVFSIQSMFELLQRKPMSIMELVQRYMVPPHVMVNIIHVMHFCKLLRRFKIKASTIRYRASNLDQPFNADAITAKLNEMSGHTFPLRVPGALSFPRAISAPSPEVLGLPDTQQLPCHPRDLQPNEQALAAQQAALDAAHARYKLSSSRGTPAECHQCHAPTHEHRQERPARRRKTSREC